MKQTVVIGLLGTTLDNMGKGSLRWERWRPTVSLCQHGDLLIHRLEILYSAKYRGLLKGISKDIAAVSPETEIVTHEVNLNNPWDFEEVFGALHDFATNYPFDQENDYLVHISTGTHVAQICLFLLTEARYFPANLIQTGPGRGRTTSSAGAYSIIDLDLSRYDAIASRFHKEWQDDISFLKSGIETRNIAFNQLIEQIEKVATNSVEPILLTGPTGAGKSLLAKRIYELKKVKRKITGLLIEVNCATLKGENAMAALFGHTKGAFTGAAKERPGLLRTADHGLLFLDEVGELGIDEQAMLLRAIEEKRFLPVGADQESHSEFQLICGTNRDLEKDCDTGKFREDLLARINLWTFELPGLAQRPEDMEPNLDYELCRISSKIGSRVSINKEARDLFLNFATSSEALWSANFRDLTGTITRMATLAPRGRITSHEVKAEISTLRRRWRGKSGKGQSDILMKILSPEQLNQLDLFDQNQLADVVRICQNSATISEAGRKLFNVSRKKKKQLNDSDRLRKYLGRFGLDWNSIT
ncbi:MAG: RNA repair transcriptional activator RtcR [Desulfobulbaceae bacterium]|nr:RNA repair transcriptional activator RtcR [Desulfobulbaceae bacterium]